MSSSKSDISTIVTTVRQCSHAMEAALDAVKTLISLFSSPNQELAKEHILEALQYDVCESLADVLRYNSESADAFVVVCNALSLLCSQDIAVKGISAEGILSVIVGTHRSLIVMPQVQNTAEMKRATDAVKQLLKFDFRATSVQQAAYLGTAESELPLLDIDRFPAIISKIDQCIGKDEDVVTRGLSILLSLVNVPRLVDPSPACTSTSTPTTTDGNKLSPNLNSVIEHMLLSSQVLDSLHNVLVHHKENVKCVTMALNMFALLADPGEEASKQVCCKLKDELPRIFQSYSCKPTKESSILCNTCLLLFCRLSSIASCAEMLWCTAVINMDANTYVSSADIAVKTLIDGIDRTLQTAGKDSSQVDTYNRHTFGLSMTLLVALTNTPDDVLRELIVGSIVRYSNNDHHPHILSVLFTLLPKCENRLLLATLNVMNALFSYSAVALSAIKMGAWEHLMERLRDVMQDVICEAQQDTASVMSGVTEYEGFSTVKSSKIMAQVIELLVFLSSSTTEAIPLILDPPTSIASTTTATSTTSSRYMMRELMSCVDILLMRFGCLDITAGINALTIIYNLVLATNGQIELLQEINIVKTLLNLFEKYLPGTNTQHVSTVDKFDVATLVLGIFTRFLTTRKDAFGEQSKSRTMLIENLLKGNIVFSMKSLGKHYCEDMHDDLMLFQWRLLSIFAHDAASRELFYNESSVEAAISILLDMLNSPVCIEDEEEGYDLSQKTLELVLTIHSTSGSVLTPLQVSLLLSYRSVSVHANDPKIVAVLDQMFVVAENCDGRYQ